MLTYPAPIDPSNEYLQRPPEWVQIGSDILVVLNVVGTVASVDVVGDAVTPWAYWLDVASAAGASGVDGQYVQLPDDLTAQPTPWWLRQQILVAEPRYPPGTTFSVGDGSFWVATVDGRIICTAAGSTFARYQRMRRGELQLLPEDQYKPPTQWAYTDVVGFPADQVDWIPYPGAGISPGGYVSAFSSHGSGVVDEIEVNEYPTHTRYSWKTGGTLLGWRDVPTDQAVALPGHTWTVFERTSAPAGDTLWRATDGSLWVHIGSGDYVCYGDGTRYPSGSGMRRGDIPGGLIEVT